MTKVNLMSGSTQPSTDRLLASTNVEAIAQHVLTRIGEALRVAAFWGAILLPLAYVPVLHKGIAGQRVGLFLLLLALHVACILLGHERAHDRSSHPESSDVQ